MPGIGPFELILLLIILVIVFGIGKLPRVGRELGRALREFRDAGGSVEGAQPKLSPGQIPHQERASRLERVLNELEQMGEELTLPIVFDKVLEALDISSYKLEQETGIHRSTIDGWRKGEHKPTRDKFTQVVDCIPGLSPAWREEFLALAGIPSAGAPPVAARLSRVYLSCHGEDLTVEQRTVERCLSRLRSVFIVEVGDETWAQDDITRSIRGSDYAVIVQGWRWVALRRVEHQAVQDTASVTGLYFQKQGLSLQPEAQQFFEEVGGWRRFSDPDDLAEQVCIRLCETMADEAREGRARCSLQAMAMIFLATQLLTGEEASLPSLLERLATGKEEIGTTPESPPEEPTPKVRQPKRRHPLEPKLVPIPAGKFWMGTERWSLELAGVEWQDWMKWETPYHQVYLPDYEISKYPVTNAEYARFVEATGRRPPSHWTDPVRPPRDLENHPVVHVTWHDAMAYCDWLTKETGRPFTLPSEAEWEKAARWTDGRVWPWGNWWDPGRCNTAEGKMDRTTPVGYYSPGGDSRYGVSDMAGNVWEWTRSLWGASWEKPEFGYPYDPGGSRESLEAGDEILRVVRGGYWDFDRDFARCAFRVGDSPSVAWSDDGFRIVVSPHLS